MPSIQIKDVPTDTHVELRRRAALAGQSLRRLRTSTDRSTGSAGCCDTPAAPAARSAGVLAGRVTSPSPLPKQFSVEVPDEVVDGHYADLASLWHTRDVFVLDFAALKAAPQRGEVDGTPVLGHSARVVTRVRIPPAQVFELMKALESQLSTWEKETGQRPGGG